MIIKDGYIFLTADDEEPDCMKCDYCTQTDCEKWCGADMREKDEVL